MSQTVKTHFIGWLAVRSGIHAKQYKKVGGSISELFNNAL